MSDLLFGSNDEKPKEEKKSPRQKDEKVIKNEDLNEEKVEEEEIEEEMNEKPKIIPKVDLKKQNNNKPTDNKSGEHKTRESTKKMVEMESTIKLLQDELTIIKDWKKQSESQPKVDTFSSKIQEIKIEQEKLNAQLVVLDKIKEIASVKQTIGTQLKYFSSHEVAKFIKQYLKIMDIPDGKLTSVDHQRRNIPNYNEFKADKLELLTLLSRCLRDGRAFERYNDVQVMMNEKNI